MNNLIIVKILQSSGVKFEENGKCFYKDKEYFWSPNSPYKIYDSEGKSEDFYYRVKNSSNFKLAWKKKVKEELEELIEQDDKDLYQIHVNTQDLGSHSKEVSLFLSNYDMLKIASPMATRKSNVLQEVIAQSSKANLKCIFVTNRVSLSFDIASKYNIEHYQSTKNPTEHLVVQFDSLHHYNPKDFDIMIVDEISSLMSYISTKYNGKEGIHKLNVMKFLALGNFKKVVISDAFILDYPWENKKELGIYNSFRETHDVFKYSHRTSFLNKIKIDISKNRNISISSNEKRFLIDVSEYLKENNISYILLTGDNKNKDNVYKQLENKNLDVSVILYSPVLTVGVSIMKPVYSHFHYDVGGTTSAVDSIQQLRRVRNVENIHIFLKAKSAYNNTKLSKIERSLSEYISYNEYGEPIQISSIGKQYAKIKKINNILMNSSTYGLLTLIKYQFKQEIIEVNRNGDN